MEISSSAHLPPGTAVKDPNGSYIIVGLLNANEVLVEDVRGRVVTRLARNLTVDTLPQSKKTDLATIPDASWQHATARRDTLRSLLAMKKSEHSREKINQIAQMFDVHETTVYRWIKKYRQQGTVSCLLRQPRADKNQNRLGKRAEEIIKKSIEDVYLTKQKCSIAKVVQEVHRACKNEGLHLPDAKTVRSRVLAIAEETRVRRRDGSKTARAHYQEIRGSFPGADFPLAVVQIDHTPMDIIVVDDMHRLPINRPYLTLAIDVYSKMCVGFYISLDPPGWLATGICIGDSILPKESVVSDLGIEGLTWPCWGKMRTIHTDNAKEFRGSMMGRSAKEYDIIAQKRPKGSPQYGGHIERSFRTFMSECHDLPGTTFSNPRMRREYDSAGKAVMTLDALVKWFRYYLLGVYHQQPHEGNKGLPPLYRWEQGIFGDKAKGILPRGIPARYPDEERVRIDFLPFLERTVQRGGVLFEGIHYWADALRPLILSKAPNSTKLKRMFVCRYDPRDLSCIWIYDVDTTRYIKAVYRNLTRPPVSLWEVKAAKKKCREEGIKATNEELIFKAVSHMREVVESESEKSKQARRLRQRQKGWEKTQRANKANAGSKPLAPASTATIVPMPPAINEDHDDLTTFEIWD